MRRWFIIIALALLAWATPLGAQVQTSAPEAPFTCNLQGIAATLTQCQAVPAAASLRYYVTSIQVQTTTATSGTFAVQTGTGTNCATGTAGLFPKLNTTNRFNAPTNANPMADLTFTAAPLQAPAGAAVCVIGVATNTISIQISGYIAP